MGKYDKKPASAWGAKPAPRKTQATSQEWEYTPLVQSTPDNPVPKDNPELREIAQWLSKVKFRQKAVGGLDPADVWKKIEELNGMYEMALAAERMRYNLMLRQIWSSAESPSPEAPDGEE